jgi:hypothetical protein
MILKIFLEIIISLITGIVSGVIVALFGIKKFKEYIESREKRKILGPLINFWTSDVTKSKIFSILYGIEIAKKGSIAPVISYAKAIGLSEIRRTIKEVNGADTIIYERPLNENQPFLKSDFDENVIILGGESSIKKFGDFCRNLRIPYYHYKIQEGNRNLIGISNDKLTDEYKPIIDFDSGLKRDVGSVMRIINPNNKKLIILFNGSYAAGLLGSILFTTNRDLFFETGFDSSSMAQQIVVEIPNISNNIISHTHSIKNISQWTKFSFNEENYSRAIDISCSQ